MNRARRAITLTIYSKSLQRLCLRLVACSTLGMGFLACPASAEPALPNADFTTLAGHLPPVIHEQRDRGEAPDSLKLEGLDIIVAKTSSQEADLKNYLVSINNPRSPEFHRWLTPSEYGRRFGASDETIKLVKEWLESFGLKLGQISDGRGHIPFAGTKSQVEKAFHTQIHVFERNDIRHYSIVAAPSVPTALAPAIKAVRGLNDFRPRSGLHQSVTGKGLATGARSGLNPEITIATNSVLGPNYLGPSDFAVIYGLNPLYQQHLYGQGVTVAVAAQSDIDSTLLPTYWRAFGVSGQQLGLANQQFTSVRVPAANSGSDPGRTNNTDESEAYLDTELIGGIAPGASIILVRDKSATVAAQYAIDNNLAAVLSISFGLCEQSEKTLNASIESMYQQAVAQGMTVLVSSGDSGAAGCDDTTGVAVSGYGVNALASTPYNIAVGGTEFDLNQLAAQHWSGAPLPTLLTAQSYIPETVWNESCASPTLVTFYGAVLNSSNPVTFCNTPTLGNEANPFLTNFGSGGGLSSCTGVDSKTDVCTGGYAQPSWQTNVPGITNFGTRGIPDISTAATHWVTCDQTEPTCDPTTLGNFGVEYGTSAAAPASAAIVAILDQALIDNNNPDGRQGLLVDRLYSIAGAQWSTASTLSGCNGSLGANVSANCVFYDITTGSNDQPCLLSTYASSESLPASVCSGQSGGYGVMTQGSTPAYVAGAGFDLATGLGSVNASNLIAAFSALNPPAGLQVHAAGTTATLSWSTDAAASTFNVYEGNAAGGETDTPVQSGVTGSTTMITALANGQTFFFTISASTPYGTTASSNETSVTIVPAAPARLTATVANKVITLTWNASPGATGYNLYEGTGSGAEGTVPVQSALSIQTATVSGLAAGQTYYFTVAATDAGGTSAASAEANAAVPAPSGGGGGGSLDWLCIGGLLSGVAYRLLKGLPRQRRVPAAALRYPNSTPGARSFR